MKSIYSESNTIEGNTISRLSSNPKIAHYWQSLKRYLFNHQRLIMYTLGRFQIVRKLVLILSRQAFLSQPNTGTLLDDISTETVASGLEAHGYYAGLQLPPEIVEKVLRFAETNAFYDDQNPEKFYTYQDFQQPEVRDRHKVLIGRYTNTVQDCPVINALQRDPQLLAIATKYLGRPPGHSDHRLWWSLANSVTDEHARVRSGQEFHYDLDDYRTISFFFYLKDVDTWGGPLMFIQGSHKKKKLTYLLSMFKARPQSDLLKFYCPDDFLEMRGLAGFGFAVDLFGYHRGKPPEKSDRLALQIRFALYNYNQDGQTLDGFQGAAVP
jgi:hypothetical protein